LRDLRRGFEDTVVAQQRTRRRGQRRHPPDQFRRPSAPRFLQPLDISKIEDESEGLIDGADLVERGYSSFRDDAFRGNDANLVAACE
jgi:hypothetical protein